MADLMTDSILVVADRLYTVLNDNKATFTYNGKTVQDVWFGDQDILPRTPSLCVQPSTKRRPLAGVPSQVENTIDVVILLYHAPVSEQQDAQRDTIGLAHVVETWLHNNHLQLNDTSGNRITIHGWVVEADPGYVYKGTTLHHAVQMIHRSLTKTRLKTT